MSVVIETTLGDITVDLFVRERPRACRNFLKLCKTKYYNYNLFHTISRGFIAQTGDPTGSRNGGESIFGVLEGPLKRYFEAERNPRIKHTVMGLLSFVGTDNHMIGSQFFITLGSELTYLDEQHCVFGEVMEGLDVLEMLNETICDQDNRPYKDVRITHTVILDDPFPDPESLRVPSRSPSPSAERLQGGRIAPDEEVDETQGRSVDEVNEVIAAKEAKARATILEMIGDIPDAEMAPPENVLFVCKLNPVTTDDDLEIIFSRFGKINSCEVIRDKKTEESLQYAFVEFDDRKACEDAYFKMDNVLIDDRRIHVDFSQSVAKVKWHGKGRGVTTYDDKGKRFTDRKNDLGKGNYKKVGDKNQNRNANREENYQRRKEYRDDYSYSRNRDHEQRDKYYNQDNSSRQRNSSKYQDRRFKNKWNDRLEEKDNKMRRQYRSRSRSPGRHTNRREDSRYQKQRYENRNVDVPKKSNVKHSSKSSARKRRDSRSRSMNKSRSESSSSSDSASSEEERNVKTKHKKKEDDKKYKENKSKKAKNKKKSKYKSSSDES